MSYPDANPTPSRGEKAALALAGALADSARIVIPVVAALVALAVALNAGLAIARLFDRLGADIPAQVLAASASVGVLSALVGVLALSRNANLRALALLFILAWLPMALALVGLEASIASDMVRVPDALTESGRILAGLFAGLALLPVVTLAVASKRADPGDVRLALGHYIANTLKLVLLLATSGANVAFGLQRGVPLEVVIFVAVVLETAFILALVKTKDSGLHAGALVTFGAALGLVSVETLAALSGLKALADLAALGEALYLLTPALAIAYIVGMTLSERQGDRILRRVATTAGTVRGDLADLRAALRGAAPVSRPLAEPTNGAALGDAELVREIVLNGHHSMNGAGHDPKG